MTAGVTGVQLGCGVRHDSESELSLSRPTQARRARARNRVAFALTRANIVPELPLRTGGANLETFEIRLRLARRRHKRDASNAGSSSV
jgi:hypothetical protein